MKRASVEEMSLMECVLGTLSSLIQFVSLLSSPCPAFCVYEVRERTSSEIGSCHHGDLILDAETLRPVTTECTSEALANVWFLPLSCLLSGIWPQWCKGHYYSPLLLSTL